MQNLWVQATRPPAPQVLRRKEGTSHVTTAINQVLELESLCVLLISCALRAVCVLVYQARPSLTLRKCMHAHVWMFVCMYHCQGYSLIRHLFFDDTNCTWSFPSKVFNHLVLQCFQRQPRLLSVSILFRSFDRLLKGHWLLDSIMISHCQTNKHFYQRHITDYLLYSVCTLVC